MGYPPVASRARPDVAKKLGAVIAAQKSGVRAPLTGLRAGRVDRTRVARLGCRDLRVFHAQAKPAPKKVKVVVLLDASGSMKGYEANIAVQMGRDFIEMSLVTPNVEVEVWAHTTHRDYTNRDAEGRAETTIDIYPLWKKGIRPEKVNRYLHIDMSGNEDGWAVAALGDRLAEMTGAGETGILVVVSDGAPAYSHGPENPLPELTTHDNVLSHVRGCVEGIRARGHAVISVSVSRALSKQEQVGMYGRESVIPYQHNMNVVARQIGAAIGKQFNG